VDEGDDGIIERSVREVYSQHNRLTRVFTDIGDDGVDDEYEGRIYDASGLLLSVMYDLDVDGTFDLVMDNAYDVGGALVHSETTYNSTVLSEYDFTPGPCGPVAVAAYGLGGELLRTGVYTWSSTSMVLDLTEVGSTYEDSRITQLFDAATGRTEYLEHDIVVRPGVEEWTDYLYDPSTGLLASVTRDGPSETLYSYDASLRLVEELHDDNGMLVRSTTQWTCP
jgi:hypothetical protein